MVRDVPKTQLHLPRSLSELTAEWLSKALSPNFPGVEVTSVHHGDVVRGTNTKVRLLLGYNEAGHSHRLPPTMFAKCGFEVHSPLVAECARSELKFYQQRAPQAGINAPKCYFAGLDDGDGSSFLLLEDLLARNVSFGYALRPVDPQTAQKALAMLARYHAQWWNSPGKPQLHTASGNIVTDVWLDVANFELSRTLPRFVYVPPELHDRKRFLNAVYRLWDSNLQGTHCILHGDLALGNCFFDADGSPGFLDGQGDTLGCWAHDFTTFVITALDVEDRRNHERSLLALYLDELRARGADAPSFDEAWLQYRRNIIWPGTAAVLPVQFQPETVCSEYTRRAMTAATDLDTLGSLEG